MKITKKTLMKLNQLKFALLIVFATFSLKLASQNTSVTFYSDNELAVRVNQAIDGAYNFAHITDKLELKPNTGVTMQINANNFTTLNCQFSNGLILYLLLEEGDHLIVKFSGRKVSFEGDNAVGNQFITENYRLPGLAPYYEQIEQVLKPYVKQKIDFEGIDKALTDSLINPMVAKVNQLKKEGKITPIYADLMTELLTKAYLGILFYQYKILYQGRKSRSLPAVNNFKPTKIDSVEIVREMDKLYERTLKKHNPMLFFFSMNYYDYFQIKYKQMDNKEKQYFAEKYPDGLFGYLKPLLLAPDSLQIHLLGSNLLEQLENMYHDYDHKKALNYLTGKFPTSEYPAAITALMNKQLAIEQNLSDKDKSNIILLDSKSIKSLEDLTQSRELKNNFVFIDLWSIYCMPCKVQFRYAEELHRLLENYQNVKMLYITTDGEELESEWKKQIEYYKLDGYHLMLSKELKNELSDKIYNNGAFYIPRYILVNPVGEIVNNNLPRPQALDKLKEELVGLLKK